MHNGKYVICLWKKRRKPAAGISRSLHFGYEPCCFRRGFAGTDAVRSDRRRRFECGRVRNFGCGGAGKKGKWLALVGAEGEEKDLDLFDFSCAVGDGVDLETIQSVVEALQDAMPPADVLPPSIILARIEDFLRHHNTCALATSYGEDVRNTTIEYGYDNGIVYLFSEGGKKFANIFRNPRVSIAVFDNYIDFSHIGGLRLDGIAAVYEIGHPLYEKGAALRGISVERLAGMAVPLHLIAVTLTAGDFLWHGFKNDGGFAHQRYYWQ